MLPLVKDNGKVIFLGSMAGKLTKLSEDLKK
jgi:hypothetical protein